MRSHLSAFLAIILIIQTGCKNEKQTTAISETTFSLTGKTQNIKDSTKLYFHDLLNGKKHDSAFVMNNQFQFETELPEPFVYVMLTTKDRSLFREMWLEDTIMTLDATKGEFMNAKVTGSKTMEEQEFFKELDYDQPTDKIRAEIRSFIETHPNSPLSAIKLADYGTFFNKMKSRQMLAQLSEKVRNTRYGQRAEERVRNDRSPDVGEHYLNFQMDDVSGERQEFSKLTGKLTLLQFWASWCGFSKQSNYLLKDVYEEYHNDGLEVVGVSLDTKAEAWKQAIEEQGLKWTNPSNLQGREGPVVTQYSISATPDNFLLDAIGKVLARGLSIPEYRELIEANL